MQLKVKLKWEFIENKENQADSIFVCELFNQNMVNKFEGCSIGFKPFCIEIQAYFSEWKIVISHSQLQYLLGCENKHITYLTIKEAKLAAENYVANWLSKFIKEVSYES